MRVTGTGVWSHHLRYGDPGEIADAAAELDELGYDAIWIPDVGGDVMAGVENLLQAAPRIVAATGVLNIWMHNPADIAARRALWRPEWQRRFLCGLGVSHAALIDHDQPGRYQKPFSKMVGYLDALDEAAAPLPADARVLAALRPRMLRLARDRAAGAHPYFVPVEHIARAREMLGIEPMIAVELAVVLDRDPASARATARQHTATYVGLPNYTNNLRGLGFNDEDFADRGSDRLVDAIVAWGDVDTIASRAADLRAAGADHVCIQVIRTDNDMPRIEWREVAPALLAG